MRTLNFRLNLNEVKTRLVLIVNDAKTEICVEFQLDVSDQFDNISKLQNPDILTRM